MEGHSSTKQTVPDAFEADVSEMSRGTTKWCSAGIYGRGWAYAAGHTGVAEGVRGQLLALNSCPKSSRDKV